MTIRSYIWILAAIGLILPPSAAAEPTRVMGSGEVGALEAVARAYWAPRGVGLVGEPEVYVVASTEAAAGWGTQGSGAIWLQRRLLGPTVGDRAGLCMVYLHERGHNAGLTHGSGWPIMRAEGSAPPPKCWAWAKWGWRLTPAQPTELPPASTDATH